MADNDPTPAPKTTPFGWNADLGLWECPHCEPPAFNRNEVMGKVNNHITLHHAGMPKLGRDRTSNRNKRIPDHRTTQMQPATASEGGIFDEESEEVEEQEQPVAETAARQVSPPGTPRAGPLHPPTMPDIDIPQISEDAPDPNALPEAQGDSAPKTEQSLPVSKNEEAKEEEVPKPAEGQTQPAEIQEPAQSEDPWVEEEPWVEDPKPAETEVPTQPTQAKPSAAPPQSTMVTQEAPPLSGAPAENKEQAGSDAKPGVVPDSDIAALAGTVPEEGAVPVVVPDPTPTHPQEALDVIAQLQQLLLENSDLYAQDPSVLAPKKPVVEEEQPAKLVGVDMAVGSDTPLVKPLEQPQEVVGRNDVDLPTAASTLIPTTKQAMESPQRQEESEASPSPAKMEEEPKQLPPEPKSALMTRIELVGLQNDALLKKRDAAVQRRCQKQDQLLDAWIMLPPSSPQFAAAPLHKVQQEGASSLQAVVEAALLHQRALENVAKEETDFRSLQLQTKKRRDMAEIKLLKEGAKTLREDSYQLIDRCRFLQGKLKDLTVAAEGGPETRNSTSRSNLAAKHVDLQSQLIQKKIKLAELKQRYESQRGLLQMQLPNY